VTVQQSQETKGNIVMWTEGQGKEMRTIRNFVTLILRWGMKCVGDGLK
jgi:hypothetical protein